MDGKTLGNYIKLDLFVGICKESTFSRSQLDKIDEEIQELKDAYDNDDRYDIIEEACDAITAIVNFLYRNYSVQHIENAMTYVTVKNNARKYLEE